MDSFTVVPYREPYDWGAILMWLGARAIAGVERVGDDFYARASATVRHDRPRAALLVSGGEDAEARARRLFDVDADPRAIRRVLARDPLLAPLLRRRRGIRVPGAWDPFELAVRAVVGQQVSVAAARTLLGRIAARHGITPSALAEVVIDGMPRKRAETIRILARAVASGEIALDASSAAALTSIPGIGPWTAQYIAMRLGDSDAFPSGDLILRRNAGNLSERELLRRAESWRPYRAYGAMLLWTATV
jgi:AraC family transcriptional regulator, regulatory protein of adaptative response / DNA-3-methyladenine glycosylase II